MKSLKASVKSVGHIAADEPGRSNYVFEVQPCGRHKYDRTAQTPSGELFSQPNQKQRTLTRQDGITKVANSEGGEEASTRPNHPAFVIPTVIASLTSS